MFQFRPVKQFLFSPELGNYQSYGIHVFILGDHTEAFLISDVSCDLGFVTKLASLCTQLQLDPIHIQDVILDALP